MKQTSKQNSRNHFLLWCWLAVIILAIVVGIVIYQDSLDDKKTVTFDRCVDGDTAWFYQDGQEIKVRFLAIDSPEVSGTPEYYGSEAQEYTCLVLTSGSTIQLELDPNSTETDRYGRTLAWVWVDGSLLQKQLVSQGYAEVKYEQDNYKYVDELRQSQQQAQQNQLGLWGQ